MNIYKVNRNITNFESKKYSKIRFVQTAVKKTSQSTSNLDNSSPSISALKKMIFALCSISLIKMSSYNITLGKNGTNLILLNINNVI